MIEILINDKRLDLSDITKVGVTYCANNIGELQNRQGNFSNTFKVPITKNNSTILEWSNLQTSVSNIPYQKNNCTLIHNGVEIVSNGIATLNSSDNDFFYINVVSGNIYLIDAIGDITVGSLYANDIVYSWSLDNAVNSVDKSKYFIYPLIDWREDRDDFYDSLINADVAVSQLLPCVLISKMFDRLEVFTGFNFSGNYLNSDIHQNMVLTPDSFNNKNLGNEVLENSSSQIQDQNTVSVPVGSGTVNNLIYPTFSHSYNSLTNVSNVPDFVNNVFKPTINKVGKLKFKGKFGITWKKNTNFIPFTASNLKNGEVYVKCQIIDDLNNEIKVEYSAVQIKSLDVYEQSYTFDFDIETLEYTFLSTRSYYVRATAYYKRNTKVSSKATLFDFIPSYANDYEKNSLTFESTDIIAFGNGLDFTTLFQMKVLDVLKDILNLNGIIIQTNNYTKTVSFNTFEDLTQNKNIAKNWTNKLQPNTAMIYKFGNYAKKNNLKFKLDVNKTFNVDGLHDGYFNLDNENLDNEKDVVKLNHPATSQSLKYGGFNIPEIDGLRDVGGYWTGQDWRLLNLDIKNTFFLTVYSDGATTVDITLNVPFCKMLGLDYFVNSNYQTLIEILQSPKVIRCENNLDITDITDLDFSIPVFIDVPSENINGYFYINKIENYKGGITTCEIIQL